ncbi:MAG: ABC transporter substrate-binding protein [Gammaproteobacteria bacterium]|nr:MAG: ABC transporter substrate-binding protein [Gammaproteobacteria bacterium]
MFRIISLVILIGCQFSQYCYAREAGANNIFVSILPQKYFVERIAGEHVKVSVMVGNGQNPATYEPTPKQMALLDKAQLYFQIGVPFESIWIDAISELNPDLEIIECCTELITRHDEKNSHEHNVEVEHAKKRHAMDPHIWTSPANAKYIALKMKKALIDNYPVYAKEFETNYSRLIEDLDRLDQDIKSSLAHLKNRYIIVSHPSWGYYAEAYDLIQVPIEVEGKEVRAKSLAKLIEFARSKNINRVFVQKQFNKNSAEIIAREIAADVIELDPLAEDYIANLYYVTDAIANRKN